MKLEPAFKRRIFCMVLFVLAGAATAQAPKPISLHEKAARDLYRLLGGPDLARSRTEALVRAMHESRGPEDEDAFRAWCEKVFAAEDLEAETVKLYMRSFSEPELRELVAFGKTPVGQRALSRLPEIVMQAAEIGVRRAEDSAPELEAMLDEARKKQEKQRPLNDDAAQKRTVADIRNTGTAMFSWLTDQLGAAAAGQSQTDMTQTRTDLRQYSQISAQELAKLLVPQYIQSVPETDGWGNPYEYYLNVTDPTARQVMSIRSPGKDGRFSGDDYTVGSFTPSNYDEDIVWADGFFVRWPQK
jgi:hypothetical protein